MLEIVQQAWANDALIYEFNTAFLYALINSGAVIDSSSLLAVLTEQQNLLRSRNCAAGENPDNTFLSIH